MTNRSANQLRRRRRLKKELVDAFGNQCARCEGLFPPECFDFHHTDPRTKEFPVDQQQIAGRAWEAVLREASKCVLLCANCHRTVHAENEEDYFEDAYSRHRDGRADPGVNDLPLFGGRLVGS